MESVLRRPPEWGPAVLQSPVVPEWCPVACLSQSSPPSPVLRNWCVSGASWRPVGYMENLATGKSVFEDLRGSSMGAVHMASLPPPRASGMLAQPTPRGDSQPQPSTSADFAPILEEGKKGEADQRKIGRRKSCKNPTFSTNLSCPSSPWPRSFL